MTRDSQGRDAIAPKVSMTRNSRDARGSGGSGSRQDADPSLLLLLAFLGRFLKVYIGAPAPGAAGEFRLGSDRGEGVCGEASSSPHNSCYISAWGQGACKPRFLGFGCQPRMSGCPHHTRVPEGLAARSLDGDPQLPHHGSLLEMQSLGPHQTC